MHNDDSDTALVLAAQSGDKDAFAMLLAWYGQLLLALCTRSPADSALAEDAAQEAALQAMLNLDRLRRADRFGPWLCGIGLNICRRWLRERSRDNWSWEALHGGRRGPEWPDPQAGPEALTEAADLASQVRRAVADLPSRQRSAVVLFYLSGLTHAETAASLEIEIGAVKTRLHKARRTLKQQLSDAWEGEAMDEKLSRRTLTKTAGALTGIAAAGQLGRVAAGAQEGTKDEIMTEEGAQAQLVEMRVADVRRGQWESWHPRLCVAILEEVDGTRRLPIWMGEFESTTIALHLENIQVPRPLTFTFMANLLQAIGGQLREVRINRLAENTFYAVAVVEGTERARTVDARPSDAINLALLTGAPIRVDPSVLEAVAACSSSSQDAAHRGEEGPAEIVGELMTNWSERNPTSS